MVYVLQISLVYRYEISEINKKKFVVTGQVDCFGCCLYYNNEYIYIFFIKFSNNNSFYKK